VRREDTFVVGDVEVVSVNMRTLGSRVGCDPRRTGHAVAVPGPTPWQTDSRFLIGNLGPNATWTGNKAAIRDTQHG